jgi:Carboxypeptidase regulatory-like domain
MASWPGNPIARMSVINDRGGTSYSTRWAANVPNSQIVSDIQIEWTIAIDYDDHPIFDHGVGHFDAWLYRLSDSGTWDQVDHVARNLGNDNDSGYWSDTLTLRTTMLREIEAYQVEIFCRTGLTSIGSSSDRRSKIFTAIQGSAFVGNFSLDYLPISIVYCPPNQDMSASLTQSLQYGTRMTIGTSQGFRADTSAEVEIHYLGVKAQGYSTTDSHSVTNRSEAGIEFSYFRNTVLTADNQRAIGRAYWGALGDTFVIAVKPRFAVNRRADGTLFYQNIGIGQLVVAPAYKLLRPGDDPVVRRIPTEVRRRILELDPFITNLDQFFPDSGAPLSVAVNPFADPTVNNRAECLGIWWLNNATELNYSIGETKELKTGETTETQFVSTLTIEAGFGFNLFDLIGIGGRVQDSFSTIVGLQSSKETIAGTSMTAACYLIRNQNEKDLDGIEIYYDKVFSTLMFRKLPPVQPAVAGETTDLDGAVVTASDVVLSGDDGPMARTTTNQDGTFNFYGVSPGTYTVTVGDQSRRVEVPEASENLANTVMVHLKGVRRRVDLQRSAAWDVALAMKVSSDDVWRLSHHLDGVFDESDLAHILGRTDTQIRTVTDRLIISWPRTSLGRIDGISAEEIGRLEQAGVTSMQELWRMGKNSEDLASLAESADIRLERLRDLVDSADKRRVSKTKEGLPPSEPKGCLWLLLNWIPWHGLHRRLRFRYSKRARQLVGR